jgi:hypothetical protein
MLNQFDSNQYSDEDSHQQSSHRQYEEEDSDDHGYEQFLSAKEEATAASEEQQVLEGLAIELMTLCMEIAAEQLEQEQSISVSSNDSSGSCREGDDQRIGLTAEDEDDSASRGSSQSHTGDESDPTDDTLNDSCSLERDGSGGDRRSYESGSENSLSESEDGPRHGDHWSDEGGNSGTEMQEDDESSEGFDA